MLRSVRLASGVLAITLPLACGGAKPASSAPPSVAAAQQPAAAPAPAGASDFTGTVAETMNSGGYTYARLQAAGKDDVWIAGTEFPAKMGDALTVALEMPMQNFESKTLKRTFPVIYFVSSVSRGGQSVMGAAAPQGGPSPAALPMAASHGTPTQAPVVQKVAPAPGGVTVAELWAKRVALSGKEVTVRGTVVKANMAIMGTNWIHIQDGTGAAADGTNDLTVTTDAEAKVGDVVTVKGVLATEKDFGAGYAYKAIVEKAQLSAK